MLEHGHASRTLEDLLSEIRCELELPPHWDDANRLPQGPLPIRSEDRRRYPRFHYRVRAILQCRQTFPALVSPRELHAVYTKDISRGGVSFLHSDQLFPRQKIRIYLPRGTKQDLEVVHCRQLEQRCFLIGAENAVDAEPDAVSALVRHYRP